MFNLINRNQKNTLVLVPGWAFDENIFNNLDLDYNYLVFAGDNIAAFDSALKKSLKEHNLEQISLLGWSQGAFAALEFAADNPNLVDQTILVSLRKKYKAEEIKNVENLLRQNHQAFLYKFYQDCFSNENLSWFKKNLMKNYLNKFRPDNLLNNLTLLGQAEVSAQKLCKIKNLLLIHGKNDRIAPVDEVRSLVSNMPQAKLIIIENAGHLPFLNRHFKERLANG
ncbi:MAG: alpha/beta hydrolase [Candidatus Margulisbacteria bacterium]|nr:alpha/beta hydrolase [Candidatus Margulisiibacteriota bacterium]MBU1021205.1 alpha/beta hydrolase [Candidatus Margulisiibacteriota bacterium]MBU1729811.1 alpha/beta hydrolase [Candidatus Margulisiibacteriota bacterium]MBU1955312.1 alpha/beta hydrolase [Candidatus Margulisiibacteriota bacterium]